MIRILDYTNSNSIINININNINIKTILFYA